MSIRKILFTTALSLTITACNKKADNSINYTSAVNSYYNAHPEIGRASCRERVFALV